MDFNELALSRRSIRSFQQKAVPKDALIKLMQAAQFAPSGGNCHPWHFYVISDKGQKTQLIRQCISQEFLHTAPVLIVVCADIKRSEKRYGRRGKALYCIQDTAAAIQNILLCAKSLGLGTCWCGAFDEKKCANFLQLPKDMRPVAMIPVGYPVNEPPVAPKRRPLDEIATFFGDFEGLSSSEEEAVERKVMHCDMSGTMFYDVNLANSQFNNINFSGVDITNARLDNGAIYECNLKNLAIRDCKMDGMTINGKDVSKLLK